MTGNFPGDLDEFKVRASRATVDPVGAVAEFTNSRLLVAKNGTGVPKFFEADVGAGSTCNVTDTVAVNMAVAIDCDTVIGR